MKKLKVKSLKLKVTAKILFILFPLFTFHFQLSTSSADELTAKAAIAIDADTGRILYAKNPNLRWPPASTAKVMTALLTFEGSKAGSSSALVEISAKATSAPPSKVNLNEGDRMRTEDLLYALLLKSANDAAIALAESVAGSEEAFVRLMNRKAKELGAKNTCFINASGLPGKGQYTTVYDLSIIMREALKEPLLAEILKARVAVIEVDNGDRKVPLRNHNKLLWMYEGIEGGKTGYTISARHCFAGGAYRDTGRVIIAILGSKKLWNDCALLLDKGFKVLSNEEKPEVYSTGERLNKEARIKIQNAKIIPILSGRNKGLKISS